MRPTLGLVLLNLMFVFSHDGASFTLLESELEAVLEPSITTPSLVAPRHPVLLETTLRLT